MPLDRRMPVGLVIVAVAFDALYVSSGFALLTGVSFWMVLSACAITGAAGLRHAELLEAASSLVLGVAALMRVSAVAHVPSTAALVVEAAGLLLSIVAGARLERRAVARLSHR